MGKTKSSEKSHYEILYIIPNKFTEEEAGGIDEKVKKTISDKGGNITYSENWGNKKMAYPIRGFNHGYYLLHEFDLEGDKLKEINDIFRMDAEILRHQIVKVKRRSPEEIAKEKEEQKKIVAKEEEEKEKAKEEKEKAEEQKEKAKNKEKKEDEGKKKTDLKDLDKKLDDILDSSDLL